MQNLILNNFPVACLYQKSSVIQGKTSSLATAKLAIFATDILWESCLKFDFEQLLNGGLYDILLFLLLLCKLCP